jgi:hypothetical protein
MAKKFAHRNRRGIGGACHRDREINSEGGSHECERDKGDPD